MLQNSTAGKLFYGKHFWPGVAEYREDGKVTRVLIEEDTIRQMNPSFEGKPVFVEHVDEIINKPIDELKSEVDGWVIRSFFNENDGDTWVEFLVTSQKGLDAIEKGWKLSNAYNKGRTDGHGGLWNGIEFQEKILGDAEFEHLAIVPNPRYAASIIMTPAEYRTYNENKKAELSRLQNNLSKDEAQESLMPFNLFKKTKVDQGELDISEYSVFLKNGREVKLVDLIKDADTELQEIKDPTILINKEKEEYMTIDEAVEEIKNLRNKCNELEEKLNKKNEEEKKEEFKEEFKEEKKDNADGDAAKENECGKKENEEEKKEEYKEEFKEEKKENEDKEDKKDDDKKENEDDEDKKDEDKKDNECKKNFLNEIVNANQICSNSAAVHKISSLEERVELGRKYF